MPGNPESNDETLKQENNTVKVTMDKPSRSVVLAFMASKQTRSLINGMGKKLFGPKQALAELKKLPFVPMVSRTNNLAAKLGGHNADCQYTYRVFCISDIIDIM